MANRARSLVLLLLFCALSLSACDAFEVEDNSSSTEGGMMGSGRKMGDSAMPMYDSKDPSYRVIEGQIISIDRDLVGQGGLRSLISAGETDWRVAADKVLSIDVAWRDGRMEMMIRDTPRSGIRSVADRFDWYMNVLAGSIRNRDQAKAVQALPEVLTSWEQVKDVLRQPAVDGWRLFTALILLAALLVFGTDGLLWISKRLGESPTVPGGQESDGLPHIAPSLDAKGSDAVLETETTTVIPAVGIDLLALSPARALATSRYVPLTFQLFMATAFAYILYACFAAEEYWHNNLGLLAFWAVFWPFAITLSLVTLGRIWCAVCPLGAISAATQRSGLNRPFPSSANLRSGAVGLVLFVAVVWLTREAIGLASDAERTAWFFIAFTLGAIVFGLVFSGRAWCRYVCPIGIPSGLWAMLSFLELRPTAPKCQKCITRECVRGNAELPGCPVELDPSRLDSNRDCIYCLNCVKTCPHDSMQIRVRMPGAELVHARQPSLVDAGYALWVVVALVLAHSTAPVRAPEFLWMAVAQVQQYLGGASPQGAWFLVTAAFTTTVLLGAYLLATWNAANVMKLGFRRTFAIFGYAFVPVALVATGAAVGDFLTSAWGPSVAMTAAPFGIYAFVDPSPLTSEAARFAVGGLTRPMLIAIGFAWTIILPYKISVAASGNRRIAVPTAIPYTAISMAVTVLFILTHV